MHIYIYTAYVMNLYIKSLSPPSLRCFASRGLLPVCWRWDAASLVLGWRFEL